jgi:hypothetical protein
MSYELYSLGNFELFENLCRSSGDMTSIREQFYRCSAGLWYWHFNTFYRDEELRYWHFFVSAPMMLALFRLSAFDVDTFAPSSVDLSIGTFLSQRLWYWHFCTFTCRPKVLTFFRLRALDVNIFTPSSAKVYWHFFVSAPLILTLLLLHLQA